MTAVRLVSTGAYVPGDAIDNATMERLVGPLPDDVLEGIQVKTRHWMLDPATGEHREANSELAYKAAAQALERAGLEADEVDLLITSTASPEYHLPPMATFVQDRLGLRRCATMEVRSGCAGAAEALDTARLFLESGRYRTAVVVGSEAISPLLVPMFLGKDPSSIRMRDRLTLYNFGDGAGAMVLRAEEGESRGFFGSAMACVGGGRGAGMQVIGGSTHAPLHKQVAAKRLVELKVDVIESAKFTPHVLTEALRDLLAASDVQAEDVDVVIIPEGNAGYMTEELEEAGLLTPEWVALQDKIVENLAEVGATGSAALPLAVDDAWRTSRLKEGDVVMFLAIETSKWKYAGSVLPWTVPNYEGSFAAAGADATA